MQTLNINLKKAALLSLVILASLFAAIWVFNKINTETIRVHSDSDATIFAATKQDGEWTQIGVGAASFSTRQEEPLFFQAVKGEAVSQVMIDPTNAPEESVEIKIESPSEKPSKIYDGPLTSVFVEDNTLYGVNAQTYSIISAGLDEFKPSSPKFIGLPYIENIVWRNSDNFFYRTYSGDVGVFSGGKDRGYSYFGSKGPVIDISRFDDKPIAFLSVNTIYLTPDFNRELTSAGQVKSGEQYYFNTDDKYVYYATFAHPSHYASDTESVETSDEVGDSDSTLKVLDYNGNTVVDVNLGRLPGVSGVSAMSDNQNVFAISSDNGLTLFDKSSQAVDHRLIYSSKSEGVISIKNNIYLFMPDAIWRYDEQSATMTLVAKFEPEQYLVPNSISKSIDGDSVTYTLTGNASGVYKLDL